MFKFGRYLLLGLIVSTLWVSKSKSMSIFFTKPPTPLSFIQANQLKLAKQITQTRTGNIAIEVVNSQQQPIPGVEVKIEQVTHEFEFGTTLSTQMFAQGADPTDRSRYLQLARQLFNSTVHENALKWDAMEPQRGQLNYTDADRILSWSEAHSLPLRGHTLFWEVEQWNPAWLQSLSQQDLQSAVERRASAICGRYRGRIREYDVLNEMLHGDFFRQRLGADIVKIMFQRCHAIDPSAVLYVGSMSTLLEHKN